ncbi:MAG: fosfomycin resistance glutathione transferase [Pseudomonadota bacterium]|nr:fosfomycin resistance glutathione transferase [Pseudomonadota bacterium]
MLTGLNHLTLAVRDLPRSVSFYRDLLGFRLAAQWDTGAYLKLGELWLCLTRDVSDRPIANATYTHYAFSIASADFAAFCTRLRVAGVHEWQPNRSEGDSFYFLDPDGHQLEAHVGSLASRLIACRENPYKGMQFFE